MKRKITFLAFYCYVPRKLPSQLTYYRNIREIIYSGAIDHVHTSSAQAFNILVGTGSGWQGLFCEFVLTFIFSDGDEGVNLKVQ